MRDAVPCQPVAELEQIRRHRPEGADLFVPQLASA
jgi:hypothetical protein